MRIVDYTGEINDFSDTAAFIENLDLVITVDTAVAHLSGALGKPVWTLLPAVPDWRWMLDREDSPWYPTMKLFRQSAYRGLGAGGASCSRRTEQVCQNVAQEMKIKSPSLNPSPQGKETPPTTVIY